MCPAPKSRSRSLPFPRLRPGEVRLPPWAVRSIGIFVGLAFLVRSELPGSFCRRTLYQQAIGVVVAERTVAALEVRIPSNPSGFNPSEFGEQFRRNMANLAYPDAPLGGKSGRSQREALDRSGDPRENPRAAKAPCKPLPSGASREIGWPYSFLGRQYPPDLPRSQADLLFDAKP